jgi:hypothetical protein
VQILADALALSLDRPWWGFSAWSAESFPYPTRPLRRAGGGFSVYSIAVVLAAYCIFGLYIACGRDNNEDSDCPADNDGT